MGIGRSSCCALLSAGLALTSIGAARAQDADGPFTRKQQFAFSSRAFLNAHPDMKHRKLGWDAYAAGDFVLARAEFLKAAWYGDKPSQGMLAEMEWKGEGADADRASAYMWADLAAQRGYVLFVAVRERYWRQLSEEEKERVAQEGVGRMADYGDAVAKERLAREMRRHAWDIKRSAWTAAPPRWVVIYDEHGVPTRIEGSRYYAPTFWEPEKYQAWQDAQWKDPPKGRVDVGEIEKVPRQTGE